MYFFPDLNAAICYESCDLKLQKPMAKFFFTTKPFQNIELKHFFLKNLILTNFQRHTVAVARFWNIRGKRIRKAGFPNYKIHCRKIFFSQKPFEARINCILSWSQCAIVPKVLGLAFILKKKLGI